MNKNQFKDHYRKIRWLKPVYLLGLTALLVVVSLLALRANNEHMVKLRKAVTAADKNNTNVTLALQNLQAYVTTHMNTNLSDGNGSVYPPIQLQYTYQRLVDAESDQAASSNTQLYTDAQNYCQSQDSVDFSGHNRVPCVEQYVQTHDSSLPAISPSLYEFDFVSPTWSPDLAGWSLVATVICALLCVLDFGLSRYLKE